MPPTNRQKLDTITRLLDRADQSYAVCPLEPVPGLALEDPPWLIHVIRLSVFVVHLMEVICTIFLFRFRVYRRSPYVYYLEIIID